MHDPESTPNPYAPSLVEEDADEIGEFAIRGEQDSAKGAARLILRWSVVCGLSAAPSFVYGLAVTGGQIGGMLIGILIFILGYAMLDHRTASLPWRSNPRVRRTLRITYGTRIAISVLFPIGGTLDVICGIVTVSITGGTLDGQPLGFFGALLATLIQGCILNGVLAVYAGLIYVAQVVIARIKGHPQSDQGGEMEDRSDTARWKNARPERPGSSREPSQTTPEMGNSSDHHDS